jgi:hypothetical protein
MKIPQIQKLIFPRENKQNIIDRFLVNDHHRKFFYESKRHLKSTTQINEKNYNEVEYDSDNEKGYEPIKKLPDRPYFDHVKLPPKMMKLTQSDNYNFTTGEACLPSSDDREEESEVLLANGSYVLGPGEELNVPVMYLNRSGIKTDPKANVMLHKDRFIRQIDEDISILNTLENVKKCGFTITNRTDKIVTIPDSAKLAYIDRVKTKTFFGVKNLNKFIQFNKTGYTEIPTNETRAIMFAASEKAAKAKKWVAKDPERLEFMKEQMLKSPYGKDIIYDDRFMERLEFLDEHLKFEKNSPLTAEQQWETKLMLYCIADRFCLDMEDLPQANIAPLKINTKGHPPIKIRMRPTPINARPLLKEHLEKMLRGNVIKAVNDSPYGFPLVIVPKPDGEFRICVDYREINKVTVVNQGPIPLLQDMISGVKGKPYMASLDLTKAYWQLPMNPEDAEKTTFICEEGTFMFLRVPFGLAGAVAHYQGALRDTISQIKLNNKQHMANYIDDVFIGAETYKDWLDALYKFLMKIREVNLRIGIKKSSFGGSSVKYLGFIATKDTWYPDPGRVKDLVDRPPPDDLKKLRGFCSSIAFYKRFTPNVGKLLEPLYQKLRGLDKKHSKKSRKPISVALDPEVIKAWEDCKSLLQNKIILWHIDPAKEFHIFVDASDTASGSAIMQYQDEDLRPVAFHSKVFNEAERRYGTTERELLGVLHALEKYEYIIVGGPAVHVYTDHKAVISLAANPNPTKPRLARWRIRLSMHNLKWHFIPGKDHHLADFLSRPPEEIYERMREYITKVPKEEPYEYDPRYPRQYLCNMIERDFNKKLPVDLRPEEIDDLIQNYTLIIHDEGLIEDQRKDSECIRIAEYLSDPDFRNKELKDLAKDPLAIYARRCLIHKGTVLAYSEIGEARLIPVIPAIRREAVMKAAHADKMGHLRDPRVRQLLELKCSWPSLKADLNRFLNSCSVCTQFLAGRHIKPRPAAFVADKFLEQITMDVFHLGPSKHGFSKALAMIDTWSRFGWVEPIKSESAEDQIKALEVNVCKLAAPTTILTDRAPTYLSETFKSWVINMGIEVFPGPGYATNHVAVVNRFHRTLREMLAKMASQVEDWVEALPYAMRAYNSTIHPATGFAPVSLVTGIEPHLKLNIEVGAQLKPSDLDRKDRLAQWVTARAKAAKLIAERQEALRKEAIKAYEKSVGKTVPKTVKIGDTVMRICAADKIKGGKQTAVRYFGPYVVSSIEEDGVHCHIVREIDPEGNSERIHIGNLVIPRGKSCIPIFPNEDIIRRENDLRIGPNNKPPEVLAHKYNTRSKP